MNAMHVNVVLHPWLTDHAAGEHLIGAAAALAGSGEVEVLSYTGNIHPEAVAAHLSQRLRPSKGRQLVLLPTGTESEVIAALVAGETDGVSLGRCQSLALADDAVVAARPAFGGRVTLALRSTARITCATLRPQATSAAPGTLQITEIPLQADAPYPVQAQPAEGGQPRVEGASLVISGGRGMAGPEGFAWLARIAAALGAGLGGSLPAVDAGWVPVAHQVGQSGKFVTPKLYFAVAISGTPQHMAGVSPEARIVALNNDREAAIFARCDVAVEGDWREILPLLARRLEDGTSPG
jgi:electron transfer flavoprotein alpha subunit